MLVKRVEADGTLHMTQLGMMYPGNFGLGPVAVLGDAQTLTGCSRSAPSTPPRRVPESGRPSPTRVTAHWIGSTSTSSLGALPTISPPPGVHAGTRVCVDRSKRDLVEFGDYIGAISWTIVPR